MSDLTPAFVPSPGEILEDELNTLGIQLDEFSNDSGIEYSTLERIINGHQGITREIAVKISETLCTSVELWLGLEKAYQDYLKRGASK